MTLHFLHFLAMLKGDGDDPLLKPNPPIGERRLKEIDRGGSGEEGMARSAGSNFASGLY